MSDIGAIEPAEIKRRLNGGESLTIIDVREDEEVAAGMIPGAKHIPLGQLPERYAEIERTGEIVLVCRSGARSGRACDYLQSLGVSGLKNMTGGMLAWEKL
ncbi:rhodanese-like domain-containing protein [Paenibacillus ginsengarvi]|uniref:Rhodanese-like domain-containing protein n=1 Tax=Paenibacillus ginsengarvi TaxID=400777 RepID=A0A3B0CRP4_9BACL|nr:rhodanese-like domain-containing protein [Paenibacillus ginsengarvi]RKN86691.1 rhodanese-like domain-containing protein [Paenibacillus ginsengarvi]